MDTGNFFEEAPISLWEEDFSRVKERLDGLRGEGITDFRDYFTKNPQALAECASLVRVLDVNRHTLQLYGAESKQEFHENLNRFLCEESYPLIMEQLLAIAEGASTFLGETVNLTMQGDRLDVNLKWIVAPESLEDFSRVLVAIVDVTEQKRMERKLKEVAEEWQETFDATGDQVIILDRDYRIVRANDAATRFFRRSMDEIAGLHCYELMHGSEEPVAGCPLVAMSESGRHEEAELYLAAHGIWAQVSVDPIYDDDGVLSRVVHIAKDVTDRKLADDRLKESEGLYRMLADNTHDLICMCDDQGISRYISPSVRAVLGFEPEELLGKPLLSLVHPQDLEEAARAFNQGMTANVPGVMRVRNRRKDGRYVWLESHGSPLFDEEGRLAGGLTVSRDVSEQVEAEGVLNREREQLLSIFDSINQIIYVTDPVSYEVLYVNKAMQEAFGRELVGGLCYREFQGLAEPCGFCTNSIILGNQGEPYVWEYHNPLTGRDYMIVDRIIAWPPDGKEARFELAIDITERKQAEEALRETNEQLKNFLSVAAHELRHPINLVQGYVGTLKDLRGDATPEMLEEIYAGVRKASGRLVRLVEELLEVSSIEQEHFSVELRPGRPRDLVGEALQEMRVRGLENPFEIRVMEAPEVWPLDHDKFCQLMTILLENAVNYSPAGSPVEVELEGTAEGLAVSVLDRGSGVPEEDRERIFQRFYQVEEPRHHSVPGLGLGLYIARQIVDGYGGEIHYEPRPGGGSIFRFTLP